MWLLGRHGGHCPMIKYTVFILFEQHAIYTVRGQNLSSDALFTLQMDVFKQTIINTAYIKTLEIFLSAREALYSNPYVEV